MVGDGPLGGWLVMVHRGMVGDGPLVGWLVMVHWGDKLVGVKKMMYTPLSCYMDGPRDHLVHTYTVLHFHN